MDKLNSFFNELDLLCKSNSGIDTILKFLDKSAIEFKEEPLLYSSVMNEMGGYYRDLSRYDEALDSYKNAVLALEKINMLNSVEYATILVNIGNTLRLKREFENSKKVLDNAQNILKNNVDISDYRYLALLNTYSLLYSDMKNYEKAVFYMEQTIYGIEKMGNISSLAVTYANLSALYDQLNYVDKFDKAFEKAYKIYTNELNSDIPSFAGLLNTAGIHYYRISDYEKSIMYLKQSLDISNKYFGKNLNYAITCENLSNVYIANNDILNAKQVLTEALEVYKSIRGVESEEVNRLNKELLEL